MKLGRITLAIVISLVLTALLCPSVQADDSKAEVELKVEIVSPLSVATKDARPVTTRSALLRGSLTDLGTASTVVVYFEWGTTTEDGFTTRFRTMAKPRTFRASITRLTPATTYHFRAVAEGDGTTSYGEEMSFTTKPRGRWWRWLKWLFPWLEE